MFCHLKLLSFWFTNDQIWIGTFVQLLLLDSPTGFAHLGTYLTNLKFEGIKWVKLGLY